MSNSMTDNIAAKEETQIAIAQNNKVALNCSIVLTSLRHLLHFLLELLATRLYFTVFKKKNQHCMIT